MDKFKQIFFGLDRAHGVTYVDKKGEDGQKIKGNHLFKEKWLPMICGKII